LTPTHQISKKVEDLQELTEILKLSTLVDSFGQRRQGRLTHPELIRKEMSNMSKAQDTKKDKKKQPQKTAKEKKQAKQEKKNK
jgi:hypothetical protein